jgi:hypothetical protein
MVKFVCYALRLAADAEARMIAQESSREVSDKDEDDTRSRDDNDNEDDDNVSDSNDNQLANHQGSSQKEKDLIKDAQELFHWTSRQKELVVALWEMLDSNADDDAQREAQLEVLLNMLVSFVFTLTGNKPFSSGLVHFLAVLGIDSNTNRLCMAKNYSYMLAGVVYYMRVLSVGHLLPSASRDKQTDEDRERFLQHREKYLASGSYSPMSEALSLLAYGKSVALAAIPGPQMDCYNGPFNC